MEPQPLWEYTGKPLSNSFSLMAFDFTKPLRGVKAIRREGFEDIWTYVCICRKMPIMLKTCSQAGVFLYTIKKLSRCLFYSSMHIWTCCRSGSLNGIAVWMDYHLDSTVTHSNGLTQTPHVSMPLQWYPHTRQAVHLFPRPTQIPQDSDKKWKIKYKVVFKPNSGEFEFDFQPVGKWLILVFSIPQTTCLVLILPYVIWIGGLTKLVFEFDFNGIMKLLMS